MRKVHTKIYSCPWKAFRVEIDSRLHSSNRSFETQLYEKNVSWSFHGGNRDWIGIHAISNTWRRNWWGLILFQYVGVAVMENGKYCMYVHHDWLVHLKLIGVCCSRWLADPLVIHGQKASCVLHISRNYGHLLPNRASCLVSKVSKLNVTSFAQPVFVLGALQTHKRQFSLQMVELQCWS